MMTVPLFILYIFSAFILFVAVVLYVRTFDGLSCEGLSVLDGTVAYWLAVVIWTVLGVVFFVITDKKHRSEEFNRPQC